MKWIELELFMKTKSGKTSVWCVMSKIGVMLGFIKWKAQWRRYIFEPYEETVFDADCLREIADVCEFKTKEHGT